MFIIGRIADLEYEEYIQYTSNLRPVLDKRPVFAHSPENYAIIEMRKWQTSEDLLFSQKEFSELLDSEQLKLTEEAREMLQQVTEMRMIKLFQSANHIAIEVRKSRTVSVKDLTAVIRVSLIN